MGAYEYGRWLTQSHYAPRTVSEYVAYVRRAEQAFPNLRHASSSELEAWVSSLTAAAGRQAKKALVLWYRWKGVRRNPAVEVHVASEPKRRPRPHTREARSAFVTAARDLGDVHEVVGVLFASTGARFSSVRHARWHQFDLRPEAQWHAVVKGANRSGPRIHAIPLHPVAAECLRAWSVRCGSRDWVFPGGSRGGMISEPALRAVYRDICDLADLDSVPHRQRHTAATMLVEDTDNLAIAQELLGHASIATTRLYTEIATTRVRAAVEALPL